MEEQMKATLRHFAINADDVGRARDFYEAVFGWSFSPWGPPGFFQTDDAGDGLLGALQQRRELGEGKTVQTFVTTFGVDDIRAAMAAAEGNGGRVVAQPFHIEGVGDIGYIQDCEGNICGVAQYVEGLWT
jgi:predicted enzyme related to lactoylglutathione lyase